VTLSVEADRVRVQVRDEGPGIPPAEQGRIWERFYRVPGSQTIAPPTGGLGLGLHISSTIVEKHGGHIGLISKPGQGSIFWFTLPLAPQ
jgi:signal transduction histidine kinase